MDMRLGYGLPQGGPAAGPEALTQVAQKAEELKFDSVWVWERLLVPVNPKVPYMGTADGSYPDSFKRMLDPLDALAYVAAVTKRVTLGTSVLNMPYYNPVMLARRLTTIDVLSGGRLRVGLGLGWCTDEFDTIGESQKGLGKLADEFIEVLKAVWGPDPVEHQGKKYYLPKSTIGLKPVQKPHPPIYLAAYSPSGLKRVATRANGWIPVGIPGAALKQMSDGIKAMAQAAGRNPDELEIIVRANFNLTDEPIGEGRFPFYGSPDQIKADIQVTRDAGATEIFFDPSFNQRGLTLEGSLSQMEQIREMV
jgi:probable F420-dependent oxidoreductase